jgi:ParB family chromosome partitioning protein
MGTSFFKDGKRFDGYYMAPEDVVIIGLDTKDGPEHFLWDERIKLPVPGSFVQNISKVGVIKAVTCTKLQVDGVDRAVVVDGRQRVRGARQANKILKEQGEPELRIKVIPQRGSEDALMGLSLSTNSFTQEDSMSTKARKAQRLIDRGMSVPEVADYIGVSAQTVSNWQKLLDLSAPVLKAVDEEKIAPSTALQLHKLDKSEQTEKLKELLASSNGKRPSGKKAARAAAKGTKPSLAPGKRVARKVVNAHVEGVADFVSEDFLHGIQWAIGDISDEEVDGMIKFLSDLD